jgi:hypothetical protein
MAARNFAWREVFSFPHNYDVFFGKKIFSGIHVFRFDQFSLLMYLCLLPSSATVKMDNGENIMQNSRYARNDDTAGFIDQMKNRNTSRKTEYDMKLMKNYFTSIGEVRKHNMLQSCIVFPRAFGHLIIIDYYMAFFISRHINQNPYYRFQKP